MSLQPKKPALTAGPFTPDAATTPKPKPTAPTPATPPAKVALTLVTTPPAAPAVPEKAKTEPSPVKTRSLNQLNARLRLLREHLQMSEAALIAADRVLEPTDERTIPDALGLDKRQFADLNHPAKSKNTAFNHSRRQNCEYAVIIVCSYLEEYLKSVTIEMLKANPRQLIGKVAGKQMSYETILNLGDFDNVVEAIIRDVSRTDEQCGANYYLRKVMGAEGVRIEPAVLASALMVLDMRHALVHSSGVINAAFIEEHSALYKQTFAHELKPNAKLPKTAEIADAAIASVAAVCAQIDVQLATQSLV